MQQSIFIALDGIDGSGTSTHSNLLAGFLSVKGLKIYLTQEPSNSDIGKVIRVYLKDDKIPASTDALLFAADRVLHFENDIKKKRRISGFYDFKKFLISHKKYEEKELYPKLDKELKDVEKKQIIKRINEIV